MAARKKTPAPKPVAKFTPAIAIVADVHIGNIPQFGGPMVDGLNNRARLTIQTFRLAIAAAKQAGAAVLFVAGDLFHNRRPEPAVIAEVQHACAEAGLVIVFVPGNHDMLDATCSGGNTACATLWQEATVVNTPQWFVYPGVSVLAVPYEGSIPMAQHLEAVLSTVGSGAFPCPGTTGHIVLVTHVGVWRADDAPPWMKRARDGVEDVRLLETMARAGIDLAFVGNYHEHARFRDNRQEIIQIGTLNPGGFGDAGTSNRGLMALTDGNHVELKEIPGPRFVSCLTDEEVETVTQQLAPSTPFVRHESATPMNVSKLALGGYKHHPPPTQHAEANPGGRREERTEDEAIAAFVGDMILPAGVSPDAVLELVRDCWRRAA